MKLPSKPRASRARIIVKAAEAVRDGRVLGERSIDEFRHCPLKLFAVRGYYGSRNKRGVYDDAVFVTSVDDDHVGFNANVDSSSYRSGRANLEPNQIVWYKPGFHGYGKSSGHPAFRQASVVIVRRDGDTGNGKRIAKGLFQDRSNSRFWINLHKGGYNSVSSIGCQTIPPQQWQAFYTLVRSLLKRYEIKELPYMLLNPL